jgi:hypothetical protein
MRRCISGWPSECVRNESPSKPSRRLLLHWLLLLEILFQMFWLNPLKGVPARGAVTRSQDGYAGLGQKARKVEV